MLTKLMVIRTAAEEPVFIFGLPESYFEEISHTASEMRVLKSSEENNKSEPVSHSENLVRIIFIWCR